MSNESIELYKPWTPHKAQYPMGVSRKLDGVPVRIRRMGGQHVFAYSRQNEVITSIPHIIPFAGRMLKESGSLTGELYIEGVPFKDISGLVRQKKPSVETGKLVLHVFDADIDGTPEETYASRIGTFNKRFQQLQIATGMAADDLPIRLLPIIPCRSESAVQLAFRAIMEANPNAEGVVAHWLGKPFRPGTRLWHTMKLKPEPTIDVKVVGFEEAIDKYKMPKDMVGGVVIELSTLKDGKLKTEKTNVGPGSLTHSERKVLWAQFRQGKFAPRIAEVKYMTDDTYEGLRQPTFVRWRDDKQVADIRNK